MRDARDPEREFTKNTRNVLFSIFTSSSFVVVVFFDDDDDDETGADGEMPSSIVSLFFLGSTSVLRVCSKARTKTQTEREKKREKQRREDKTWVSRVPVSICVLL